LVIAPVRNIGNTETPQRNAVVRRSFKKFGELAMAKSKKNLDRRHRDKSGRIEKKHGNTRVAALRKEYGSHFAKGRRKDMMLKNLLKETKCASLHEYLRRKHK
jgi:hypothetical protein